MWHFWPLRIKPGMTDKMSVRFRGEVTRTEEIWVVTFVGSSSAQKMNEINSASAIQDYHKAGRGILREIKAL